MNIIEGTRSLPLKAVIYGPEGIGKSTLVSNAPNPLYIDTEDGTNRMNVRRVKPGSWEELIAMIEEVAGTPGICGTLIIDTADWAEMMCIKNICARYKVSGLESFGYGKGYTYVGEEMSRMLEACNKVVAAGMNMVIIAHAKMRKQELPDEQGAFDRWELKVSKQSAPLLKEWSDLLLFLTYKTMVVTTENNSRKATGGKRVMKTSHSPVWDAKNRFGLPEEMDMDFEGISHLFRSDLKPAEKPIDILRSMMNEAGVTEAEIQSVVSARGHCPEKVPISDYADKFVNGWLIKYWPQIVELINNARKS
ncbi:MAG: ATP-binding protein [Clostridiales bacterium]|nr:ATP-binding protein [Clostridiales bacterium]